MFVFTVHCCNKYYCDGGYMIISLSLQNQRNKVYGLRFIVLHHVFTFHKTLQFTSYPETVKNICFTFTL